MRVSKKQLVKKEQLKLEFGKRPSLDRHSGVWDLYSDGVTQGLLADFMTCPQKVLLGKVRGHRLSGESKRNVMKFGTRVHDILEDLYRLKRIPKLKSIISNYEKLDKDILVKAMTGDDYVFEQLETEYGLIEAILSQYVVHWAKDFSPRMAWIGVEKEFDLPYKLSSGRTVRLRGKIDGICEFGSKVWLFETKTKSVWSEDKLLDKISLDLQVLFYLRAVKEITGQQPAGVVYNIIRNPGLKRNKSESVKEFIDRVVKDIKKRPEHYFIRFECTVSAKELEQFEVNLCNILDQLERWVRREFHYQNTTACLQGPGWACQYLGLCARNDLASYKTLLTPFPELSEEEEE